MTNLGECVMRFIEDGGTITRVPEHAFTIDWSKDAPVLRMARAMSRRGHRRRYKVLQPKQVPALRAPEAVIL